jgi:hypothetical protein
VSGNRQSPSSGRISAILVKSRGVLVCSARFPPQNGLQIRIQVVAVRIGLWLISGEAQNP